MAKPRRPRGPRSSWEPKIVEPGVPEFAAPELPESESPATDLPETETSERALMAAVEPSPEPVLPATLPAEATRTDASAFEASFEAVAPEVIAAPGAAPETVIPETATLPETAPLEAAPSEVSPPEPAAAEPVPVPAPVAFAAPALAEVAPAAPLASVPRKAAGFRIAFVPERVDLVGIGDVIAGYLRGETQAAAAHMRALADIRSPADLIRLQVGEMQRAADASLTCWSTVAHKAGRAFALR